jgi:pimeloyl-ACP methyl ester carboxylesterase
MTISGYATRRVPLTDTVSTRVVDTGGDGQPVVLIHGLAASIEAWRDVIPQLAPRHRVIAFDLPGFGEADKPDANYRAVDFFIPMLERLLDALALDRPHMVGSSMGASLIIRFAHRHPTRVDRAVLADPGGFGRYIHPFLRVPTIPGIGGLMSRPQKLTNAFALKLTVANKDRRPKELLEEVDRLSRMPHAHRAFVRTLRGIATPLGLKELDLFEQEARSVTAPTMVVWGDRDRLFPLKQTKNVKQYMPKARIEVMQGVGHFPQIDAPEAFSRLVLDHLKGS